MLNRWIELAPEHAPLYRLANNYRYQGDREKWLQTLDRVLRVPSLGLEHTRVHVDIAYDLMRRHEWKEALPHAEEAAASYSAWGLRCAADCYEGLGDFDQSESMVQAISGRYEDQALDWYFWCLRTDKGDRVSARRFAEQALPRLKQLHPTQRFPVAVWQQINGEFEQAIETYGGDIGNSASSRGAMFGAVLAHKCGKPDVRDKYLAWLIHNRNQDFEAASFADLIQLRLQFSGEPWDEAAFDQFLAYARADWLPDLYYLAGMILTAEQPDLARRYLQCAAASPRTGYSSVLLATVETRKAGLEVPAEHSNYCGELADLSDLIDELRDVRRSGTADDVIRVANMLLNLKPDLLPALTSRAGAYERLGKYPEEIADFERVLTLSPRNRLAHHNLAMLFAACEDDSIRDPQRALKHARQSAELQSSPDFVTLAALATASAAAGDFDNAVEQQKRALKLAPADDIPAAEQRLRGFKDYKPYRRPPRKSE